MTPKETAVACLACVAAIIAGVTMKYGVAWALIVGGVLCLVIAVLLFDPKAKRRSRLTPEQKAAAKAQKRWLGGGH